MLTLTSTIVCGFLHLRYTDKVGLVVLVTGPSSGLGKEILKQLLQEWLIVYAVTRWIGEKIDILINNAGYGVF